MTSDAHSTKRKILIMGLPGSGKKSLAKLLVPMFNAVWLDGEEVRKEAGWTLANVVCSGSFKHISILVNNNLIAAFVSLLDLRGPKVPL